MVPAFTLPGKFCQKKQEFDRYGTTFFQDKPEKKRFAEEPMERSNLNNMLVQVAL